LSIHTVDSEGYLVVIPLQERLIGVSPVLRVNYDEKPMFPDHSCNRTLAIDGDKIICPVASRSKSWTLATAVNANGDLLCATIILRGKECSSVAKYEDLIEMADIPLVNVILFCCCVI